MTITLNAHLASTTRVKINVLETAVQPGHVHFKGVFTPEPISEVFF